MDDPEVEATTLATDCARWLHERDAAAARLGIELVDAGPGRATLSMTVRDDMCNPYGTAHGGVLFTLADTAFQIACNSYDRVSVAAHTTMEYVRPARPGDELVAHCTELFRTRSGGTYDARIDAPDGAVIGHFRGRAHEIGGPVIGSEES